MVKLRKLVGWFAALILAKAVTGNATPLIQSAVLDVTDRQQSPYMDSDPEGDEALVWAIVEKGLADLENARTFVHQMSPDQKARMKATLDHPNLIIPAGQSMYTSPD